MTRIEKETVIRALRCYEQSMRKKAKREDAKGEARRAADARAEENIAAYLKMSFASILTETAGSVKI